MSSLRELTRNLLEVEEKGKISWAMFILLGLVLMSILVAIIIFSTPWAFTPTYTLHTSEYNDLIAFAIFKSF